MWWLFPRRRRFWKVEGQFLHARSWLLSSILMSPQVRLATIKQKKSLISSHISLNREGRWGTTDYFATSFLHLPCSPLPSGTCRTQGLSIPWCCLPTSSSVCLVCFPLSLCLARWFWPHLMNGRHYHTTAVCISLPWSGGRRVVRLPAGSWHGLPRW